MFHRNRNNQDGNNGNGQKRGGLGGLFHRGGNRNQQTANNDPYNNGPYGPNANQGRYWRDPYYEGATRSDWDHYAVRHEEALIGDPVPIMNNGLNLGAQRYGNGGASGPYGPGPLSNGPVNHGYDDTHYNKRHMPANNLDRHGNPLIGPVTANGPLAGNYSSGTVVERNLVQGLGRRTRTGAVDDAAYGGGQWGSAAWGGEPLYGNGPYGGGQQGLYGNNQAAAWGAEPLYGYRDAREYGRPTPLLPDNPWTHNELGRDYSDAYRRGTLPYSSINNVFTQPPITENFTTFGPNGERIEGTRTRNVREEIVPPMGANALGQSTTTQTTKVVKDEVIPTSTGTRSLGPNVPYPIPADALNIPVTNTASSEVIEVLPGVRRGVVVETITPL